MHGNLRLFLFGLIQLSLVAFGSSETDAGSDQRDPIAKENEETLPAAVVASEMKPGDKAQNWCNKYMKICSDSVVGSALAYGEKYPHLAAVGFGPKDKISWKCAGTLLSEKFVLTVAHCTRSHDLGPASWVLLGTKKLPIETEGASPNAESGQIHPVIRSIIHPGYKAPQVYNDIALLEIGPAVEPNALPLDSLDIHPACLPIKGAVHTPVVVATGWGVLSFGEDISTDLLKVKMDILDNDVCNKSFNLANTARKLPRGVDGTMICTVGLEGEKDICQGGAPLQVPVKDTCTYEIRGISSFGRACGLANSHTVFTRVSEYIPWIESIVWM